MTMKKKVSYALGVLVTAVMLCGANGCGNAQEPSTQKTQQTGQETGSSAEANDLDVVEPSTEDDDWYTRGNVYTDDKGRRLEAYFNDEGTLEFAIDGLSVYITTTSNFQRENNWLVYTCDDGTMIAYFPKNSQHPATLEITDGEYAGLYRQVEN